VTYLDELESALSSSMVFCLRVRMASIHWLSIAINIANFQRNSSIQLPIEFNLNWWKQLKFFHWKNKNCSCIHT